MKIMKKLSKRGIVVLVLIVAIAFAVSGALLTYYVSIDADVTTSSLIEYSINDVTYYDAEEYVDTWTLPLDAGGDTCTKDFWLQMSADSDINHTTYFHVTLEDSGGYMTIPDDGIDIYIQDETMTNVTNHTFVPAVELKEKFTVYVELDPMLISDTFTITLLIDNTE